MKKFLFVTAVFCCGLLVSFGAMAQNMYWTFTDDQEPVMIPTECDARFDEVRGGVFVPTAEEVYQYGKNFLNSEVDSVKRQAPYCFLAAALEGHADAQLELARMYNEGKYLPQDDLSAYKWSFISALNGNRAAEKFALTLEQFLTTDDLANTTQAIQDMRIKIATGVETARKAREAATGDNQNAAQKKGKVAPKALLNIFTEEDRMK